MLFSKSAKLSGASGFFFDGSSAPGDAIRVKESDASLATNAGVGKDYTFDSMGELSIFDAPIVAPVPAAVTRIAALQGLKAIDHFGLASAYDAWANDPARTFLERAFINKAQTWEKDDPTLVAAALALGIGEAELDAMFAWAAS